MIKIEKNNQNIKISGLVPGMEIGAINGVFNDLRSRLKDTARVEFDLDGMPASDPGVAVLLKSVVTLSAEKKFSVGLLNLSDELQEVLEKSGIGKDGTYTDIGAKSKGPVSIFLTLGAAAYKFFDDIKSIVGFSGSILIAVFKMIKNPRKIPVQETLYYIDKTGVDAVPIVSLICFLMGMILGFQGITQMKRFGIDIYVADLVGLGIVRELGPLMVAMICTGRAGSAFAAEIGTMKVSEEIDALTTMGIKPERILVIPKIMALFIAMPLLTIIGDIIGILGGTLVSILASDITFSAFYGRTLQAIAPANVFESLLKSVIFAVLIASVGCLRGMEAQNDAKGVGRATTSSVVSGIFLIVIADALVTFIYPLLVFYITGIPY
jgi:phospholipid/cholesterol/gamma-HCH transport system permease protein